jgi:RNA polymerase sigma-70 factor (ECF subfamily)
MAPPATNEHRLIERCRSGDLTAFDELVAQHQNRIYNLCYWTLGDADEAADAAQTVFVRAFRSFANFRGDSALSTWLHRIAINVTIDAARRRQRAPLSLSVLEGGDGEAGLREVDSAASYFTTPDSTAQEVVTRGERQRAVREALSTLPDHHRTVLVLFDIEGHSYEEVANLLELPLGTVKSRLNRARLALRDKLAGCRELFED